MKIHVAAVLAASLLSGCASTPSLKFPPESLAFVAVSSETPRYELRSGDYLIPDSQVLIFGVSSATSTGAVLGGLVGMGIGAIIDRARNDLAVGDAAAGLALKFDGVLVEALKQESRPGDVRLLPVDDPSARIELLPYAYFQPDTAVASLTFRIATTFKRPETGKWLHRVNYTHGAFAGRPFANGTTGWSDQRAVAFHDASRLAYGRLAKAFFADTRGELPREAQDLKRISWQPAGLDKPLSGMVLQEHPDYVVIMPLVQGQPFRNELWIMERTKLGIQ